MSDGLWGPSAIDLVCGALGAVIVLKALVSGLPTTDTERRNYPTIIQVLITPRAGDVGLEVVFMNGGAPIKGRSGTAGSQWMFSGSTKASLRIEEALQSNARLSVRLFDFDVNPALATATPNVTQFEYSYSVLSPRRIAEDTGTLLETKGFYEEILLGH